MTDHICQLIRCGAPFARSEIVAEVICIYFVVANPTNLAGKGLVKHTQILRHQRKAPTEARMCSDKMFGVQDSGNVVLNADMWKKFNVPIPRQECGNHWISAVTLSDDNALFVAVGFNNVFIERQWWLKVVATIFRRVLSENVFPASHVDYKCLIVYLTLIFLKPSQESGSPLPFRDMLIQEILAYLATYRVLLYWELVAVLLHEKIAANHRSSCSATWLPEIKVILFDQRVLWEFQN